MELVSLPEIAAAPAVLLDAEAAGRGKIPDHLFQRHPLLTLQPGERFLHLPAFARPAGPAAGEPGLMLQPGVLDRYDELFMAVAERRGLIAKKTKKFLLKIPPAIIYTLLQGYRPHLRYFVVVQVARFHGWPIPYNPAPLDFSVFSQKTRCAVQFCKRLKF